MSFSDVFNVVLSLILDWRLIVAFVVVILYLNFVFYVSRYKKKEAFKPKRVVLKRSNSASTASESTGESTSDGASSDSEDDILV